MTNCQHCTTHEDGLGQQTVFRPQASSFSVLLYSPALFLLFSTERTEVPAKSLVFFLLVRMITMRSICFGLYWLATNGFSHWQTGSAVAIVKSDHRGFNEGRFPSNPQSWFKHYICPEPINHTERTVMRRSKNYIFYVVICLTVISTVDHNRHLVNLSNVRIIGESRDNTIINDICLTCLRLGGDYMLIKFIT